MKFHRRGRLLQVVTSCGARCYSKERVDHKVSLVHCASTLLNTTNTYALRRTNIHISMNRAIYINCSNRYVP